MNNYIVFEEIGQSRHSLVYKGRKKNSINYYAIKSVDKSQRQKVLNEVRILRNMDHPNILKFHNWYETDNHIWLILEYCVGGDLFSLMLQDRKLPESSVQAFGQDFRRGLLYMHSNGILYCDLKPSNILFDCDGLLKFCDFGLAQRVATVEAGSRSRPKRGTPAYMAPELFESGGVHSFASDLWSLGCVLYELSFGRPPFYSTSFAELMNMILYAELEIPSGCSEALENLLQSLLQKDVRKRATWAVVCSHPFWPDAVLVPDLPEQPVFVQFLAEKQRIGADVESFPPASADQEEEEEEEEEERAVQVENQQIAQDAEAHMAEPKTPTGALFYDRMEYAPLEGDTEMKGSADPILSEGKLGDSMRGAGVEERALRESLRKSYGETEGSPEVSVARDPVVDGYAEEGRPGESQDVLPGPNMKIPPKPMTAPVGASRPRPPRPTGAAAARQKLRSPVLGTQSSQGSVGLDLVEDDSRSVFSPLLSDAERLQDGVRARTPSALAKRSRTPRLHRQVVQREPEEAEAAFEPDTPAPSPQEVLLCSSDSVVRPIVAKPKAETDFSKLNVPFEALSVDKLRELSQEELEEFVQSLHNFLENKRKSPQATLHGLAYFEALCSASEAANLFVNSSIISVFAQMMRMSKSVALKYRMGLILGLLFRNATYISPQMSEMEVIPVLVELARDHNEKVRCASLAALGEFVFYVATQQKDADVVIEAPASAFSTISRSLRDFQESLQHVASKVIFNIASLNPEYLTNFDMKYVAFSLVHMFSSAKSDNVRATAISALSRVVVRHHSLLIETVDKGGLGGKVRLFSSGFLDADGRIQTAFYNIFNALLMDPPARIHKALVSDTSLVKSIIKATEVGSTAVKGKSLLSLALMIKMNTYWLSQLGESKLSQVLERASREKDAYITRCLEVLCAELRACVGPILNQLAAELKRYKSKRSGSSIGRKMQDLFKIFPVTLQLVSASNLRYRFMTTELITFVADALPRCINIANAVFKDFSRSLCLIAEALVGSPPVVVRFVDTFLSDLIPALFECVNTARSANTRSICLRVSAQCINTIMKDSGLYVTGADVDLVDNYAKKPNGDMQRAVTTAVDSLVQISIFPNVVGLMDDQSPIPLMALKLVCNVTESAPKHVKLLEEVGFSSKLVQYLSPDHANFSTRAFRILATFVQQSGHNSDAFLQMGIVAKLCQAIHFASTNEIEEYIEALLAIVVTLLEVLSENLTAHTGLPGRAAAEREPGGSRDYSSMTPRELLAGHEKFVELGPFLSHSLMTSNSVVCDLASQVWCLLCTIYATIHTNRLLDSDSTDVLWKALEMHWDRALKEYGSVMERTGAARKVDSRTALYDVSIIVLKRLFKSLVAVSSHDRGRSGDAIVEFVESHEMGSFPDKSVVRLAEEVLTAYKSFGT